MQFNTQFNAGLTGDAAALERSHDETLARLPATIQAFILVELQKWPTLFAPEQRYQRALLAHLSALPAADLQQAVAGIARVEAESGCDRILRGDPARFQDEAQALLRKQKLLQAWQARGRCVLSADQPGAGTAAVPGGCAAAPCRAGVWQRHRCRSPQTMEPVQGNRRPRAVAARRGATIRGIPSFALRRAPR